MSVKPSELEENKYGNNSSYKKYCDHNDELWEYENNTKFFIPSANDVNEIKEFLKRDFFPDEPLCKNSKLDMNNDTGWLRRRDIEYTWKEMVIDPVENFSHSPGCIIARSSMTGKIIGCRIGKIISRTDKIKNERFDWVANLPTCLNIPHHWTFFANTGPLFEKLRFGHPYVFEDLQNADMIYLAILLSVGREARGQGLGTELMRRGYEIAKGAGCEYTHIGASSSFTQKILKKLGNCDVIHEMKYDEIRYDQKGREFFIDTGVHDSIQICNIKHSFNS